KSHRLSGGQHWRFPDRPVLIRGYPARKWLTAGADVESPRLQQPRRSARHPSSTEEGSVFNNSPPDSGGVALWAPGWLSAGTGFSAACKARRYIKALAGLKPGATSERARKAVAAATALQGAFGAPCINSFPNHHST